MLWSFLLVAWFCAGHINSLTRRPPPERPSETVLDFDEDYAVQEGDILLSTERNAVKQLWTKKVDGYLSVPYEIAVDLENRTEDIHKALNMISEKTCIRFSKRAFETDYLHFEYGAGCASYVGSVGGEQPVLVGPLCRVGNVCHEILHALGFYHEHSRYDRDDHVTILYENIVSGKRDDFLKKDGDTLGLKYDTDSILHYGKKYFSSNGKPTIQPKEEGVQIGQRTHLSDLDVQRLQKLYRCDPSYGYCLLANIQQRKFTQGWNNLRVYLGYNNVAALTVLAGKRGWEVGVYVHEEADMLCLKVEMEVKTTAFHAFSLLADLQLRPQWDKNYLSSEEVEKADEEETIYHIKCATVNGGKSRDFVFLLSKRQPCKNGDPYVIALRSVTVATVPPEENSIRSEAKCAGFLIHEVGFSICKVSYYNQVTSGVLPYVEGNLAGWSKSMEETAMSCISFLERDVLTTEF